MKDYRHYVYTKATRPILLSALIIFLVAGFGACALRKADFTTDIPEEGTIAYGLVDFTFTPGPCSSTEAMSMLIHLGAISTRPGYASSEVIADFPTGWSISIDSRYPEDGVYTICYWETGGYSDEAEPFFFAKE